MIIDLWLDFYEYESRKDTSLNRLRFPPGKLNYHLYYILLFGDTAICFLFDLKNDHLNVQVIFTSDCISQTSLSAQRTKKPIILENYSNIMLLFACVMKKLYKKEEPETVVNETRVGLSKRFWNHAKVNLLKLTQRCQLFKYSIQKTF